MQMHIAFFHLIMAIDHWMHVIWTQPEKATNAQLLLTKAKERARSATNFVQLNVKETSPTLATESAFLSTKHAMENV
jgi:hypothetical protein